MKALRAVSVALLWFTLTAGTLWALGLDPVTSVRYAWVAFVAVALGTYSVLSVVTLFVPVQHPKVSALVAAVKEFRERGQWDEVDRALRALEEARR